MQTDKNIPEMLTVPPTVEHDHKCKAVGYAYWRIPNHSAISLKYEEQCRESKWTENIDR